MEHTSRSILSEMFDRLIAYLVQLKERTVDDDDLLSDENLAVRRATQSIWDALGGTKENASLFANFLPSLPKLFEDICNNHNSTLLSNEEEQNNETTSSDASSLSDWQLIEALSKILEVITMELDRFVMICCDE